MSDLTVTVHNFLTMLRGKSDFNQFKNDEAAMFKDNIASLDASLQPAATLLLESFKAGASSLVGAGMTAIGPLLAETTETQATQVLNLLSAMGVPTTPPLNIAEQAALITAINGLKAGLDRIGLHISTAQVAEPPAPPPMPGP